MYILSRLFVWDSLHLDVNVTVSLYLRLWPHANCRSLISFKVTPASQQREVAFKALDATLRKFDTFQTTLCYRLKHV